VSSLAELLSTIRYLAINAECDREWEKSDSEMPAQLRAWLGMGAAILVAMTQEETDKLLASVQPADAALAMASSGDLTKRADEALAKVTELTTANEQLQKRVTELEAQPEPAKGVVKVIEKKDDARTDSVDDLDELIDPNAPDFALKVMKAAQRRGRLIGPQ
jgi:predicted transcriptional regulator